MLRGYDREPRRPRKTTYVKDVALVILAVAFALAFGMLMSTPIILKFEALSAFTDYLNRH